MSAAAATRSRLLVAPAAALGRWLLEGVRHLGEWVLLWLKTNDALSRGAIPRRPLLRQLDALGLGAVPLACLTVTFSAMVLAVYTIEQFKFYGFTDYLGMVLGIGVSRELGPVLTAIVVASRDGSRMAAELASMKVTEQIDALRSLGTDPIEYLVVPRYLGALIGVPMLTLLATASGMVGGYFVAAANDVPYDVYWHSVQRGVEMQYLLAGGVKALIFGAIIATVACRQGLAAGYGSAAVGRSTTASVVLCVLLVHVADFALALVFGG
jgi:phospholipid/cholesterol/gamma-HCH transport system permease protein